MVTTMKVALFLSLVIFGSFVLVEAAIPIKFFDDDEGDSKSQSHKNNGDDQVHQFMKQYFESDDSTTSSGDNPHPDEPHIPHALTKSSNGNNIPKPSADPHYYYPNSIMERVLSNTMLSHSKQHQHRNQLSDDSMIGRALNLKIFTSSSSSSKDMVHDHQQHTRFAQVCEGKTCWSTFDPQSSCDSNRMPLKAGQTLQVFHRRQQQATPSKDKEGDTRLPATTDTMRYDSFVLEQAYQLVEPLHLELGITPKHYLDYAYRPVMERSDPIRGVPEETNTSPDIGEAPGDGSDKSPLAGGTNNNNIMDTIGSSSSSSEPQTCKAVVFAENDEDAGPSSWWKWWFSSFSNPWWKDHHGSDRSEHYKKHKTAFAGGSHGEVWRGRRVCNLQQKHRANYENDNDSSERENHGKDDCDDRQPLVLKRLNVARGYRLLEAGLREVYFGQLLLQEIREYQSAASKKKSPHVTVYVDHFFREVPRAFGSRGRGHATVDLELWIVFEDAGPSLRNYLYEPVSTSGGFIMYQHSSLWTQLRMTSTSRQGHDKSKEGQDEENGGTSVVVSSSPSNSTDDVEEPTLDDSRSREPPISIIPNIGKELMRHVLRQILSAAAVLHERGVVHRDIKPANVMCSTDAPIDNLYTLTRFPKLTCLLGDFSSGWDKYTNEHLYTKGPSPAEQTDEYAPPESYIGPGWAPFHKENPQSYDSWSIGVLALELLLGTPNVFSVDQRTTVLLTRKMEKEGASEEEIQHALYLAALSQFCIYMPASDATRHQSWPLRHGDPLFDTAMAKESCTLHDFHRALRARDPLGIGFDSSSDLLLHLVWQLLAFDPMERISAADALQHAYFTSSTPLDQHSLSSISGNNKELEAQDRAYDPRLEFELSDTVDEFICPKCGRIFSDWRSCHRHANMRRHAKFCTYDRSNLPTCINTHSMLPAHPTSGYCDLQGRRRVIEDFHSIHLYPSLQFYGIFDGHTGNLASKYAASILYGKLVTQLTLDDVTTNEDWKQQVQTNVSQAFHEIHQQFLVESSASYMDQSGTTATALLVTEDAVVIACLGDSRAVLSVEKDGTPSAFALTKDHVASDPIEQKLVEHRGGTISWSGGIPRVNGTLAITRSIGDANLAPLLSREPHVTSMTRKEIRAMCGRFHCFVVLASDGLWDVLSNQEAVDMVSQVIDSYDTTDRVSWNNGGAYQEAAEVLALEAYVRGSTDNIGVCVVSVD